MVRPLTQFALLIALLAVHGMGLVRLMNGAILCIDDAGLAVEATTETGHCECEDDAPPPAELIELVAVDCVDVKLAFLGTMQLVASDSLPKLSIVALVPSSMPDVLMSQSSGDSRAAVRVRASAAPPEFAPLAQLRTIILRT